MSDIKVLDIGDIKRIYEFDLLCFPTDCWKLEDWEELLSDNRAIYYSILDGNTIVGNIFVYNWQGEKDYVKIMNIAVHPDYRKRGYAHELLNHVTQEMKAIGMNRFCGETRASNKSMQRGFEDCGYLINTIEDGYFDNPDESAYKYVLQL